MEIIVGKNAGFCGGVEFAINKALDVVKNEKVYCLGEIVHNSQVVEKLENKGMITVQKIDEIPENSTVIFRAHGEPPSTYKKAGLKNLKVIDLTCHHVKVIHDKVEKEKKDAFIIVVGVKNHPETIATLGFSGENSYVIESEDDILDAYIEYEKTRLGKVFVVAQTTFSSEKFDQISREIEDNFCEAEVIIDKTICSSTENRQLEALKMARECNKMFIIGGSNSSNTRKLYEIAVKNCEKTYYVQTVKDLTELEFSENDKIGIMAGASTPTDKIEEIKVYLEGKKF